MKYTKEECIKKRIVLHVGTNDELVNRCTELYKEPFWSESRAKMYGEQHCINIADGCYCSIEYYLKKGYTVMEPWEFFETEYELY